MKTGTHYTQDNTAIMIHSVLDDEQRVQITVSALRSHQVHPEWLSFDELRERFGELKHISEFH